LSERKRPVRGPEPDGDLRLPSGNVTTPRRKRVRAGDVFELLIDDLRVGYGLVVAKNGASCFMVAYRSAYPRSSSPDLATVIADSIRFAAVTVDAAIWNGQWRVVGYVESDLLPVRLPLYVAEHYPDGSWWVHAFDGRSRPATAAEVTRLPPGRSYSPWVLEDALRAEHGVLPWHATYDDLDYAKLVAVRDIVI
jgi:hypothetical protein